MNVKTIVSALALASVFVAGAAEARISNRDGYTPDGKVSRSADPYLDGARYDANGPRNPFVDGARYDANGPRNPFVDGARDNVNGPRDVFTDGARL